ncbi:MAG TPA: NUDIX domain-containing protein [Actinomycetes bacterium]|nr:NUDIX domain-containing protein [Actinomycetes bacterium]
MAPIRRRAARVLVIDSKQRVLLLQGADPARPEWKIWHVPGGGIDPGESAVAAAARELVEEVGLLPGDLGPVVWTRRMQFSFDGSEYDQDEVYFVVHVDAHDVDTSGQTDIERRYLSEHRWFTVADIHSCVDLMAPPDLADQLAKLLRDGPPSVPVHVAGAVLP